MLPLKKEDNPFSKLKQATKSTQTNSYISLLQHSQRSKVVMGSMPLRNYFGSMLPFHQKFLIDAP
jgi:hypothetical protein